MSSQQASVQAEVGKFGLCKHCGKRTFAFDHPKFKEGGPIRTIVVHLPDEIDVSPTMTYDQWKADKRLPGDFCFTQTATANMDLHEGDYERALVQAVMTLARRPIPSIMDVTVVMVSDEQGEGGLVSSVMEMIKKRRT
jgi:hypothetical protein